MFLRDLRGVDSLRGPLACAADALLATILAPRCAACSEPLERPTQGPVCEPCWARINAIRPPFCPVCGGMLPSWRTLGDDDSCPACPRRPMLVDASRSAGWYEGTLRDIVHAFKYEGRRTLSTRLGRMIREVGTDLLADASCAVPVPLHPWRRFTRGFNQAADLAGSLDLPVAHALWRTRMTAPQTGLTAARRRHNVRGAFSTSPLLSRRLRHSLLVDRVVVLVDDVRTTGATLDACAGVLKSAGVAEVRALTVALAAPPDRQEASATGG